MITLLAPELVTLRSLATPDPKLHNANDRQHERHIIGTKEGCTWTKKGDLLERKKDDGKRWPPKRAICNHMDVSHCESCDDDDAHGLC